MSLLAASLLAVGAMLMSMASSASALSIGVMWNGLLEQQSKSPSEWDVVGHSGSSIYRLSIERAQWVPGGSTQTYDKVFELAAQRNVTILPYLGNGRFPTAPEYGAWNTFAREVVRRYGYSGTFWSTPGVPYKPVTAWEVQNEPNLAVLTQKKCEEIGQTYIAEAGTCVQPTNYGNFLVSASEAIRDESKKTSGVGTLVLMGGLYLPGGFNYSSYLSALYAKVPGIGGAYGGLSIHPYAFNAGFSEFAAEVTAVRDVLKDSNLPGSSSKTIWITEMGWPVGGTGRPTVTEAQQATLLTESFDWVKGQAATKKIESLIWYNLRDRDDQPGWDYHIGLTNGSGEFRPSWWAFQKETGAPIWPTPTIAFQANNGNLTTYSTSGGLVGLGMGMAKGTSPSVAAQYGSGYVIGFQINTGDLDIYSSTAGVTGLGLGLAAGTSPSIAALPSGYVVSFQANQSYLTTYSTSGGLVGLGMGMAKGTSPSIAALPTGGYEIAFQINTGDLDTYSTTGGMTGLGLGMATGTSPSLTGG